LKFGRYFIHHTPIPKLNVMAAMNIYDDRRYIYDHTAECAAGSTAGDAAGGSSISVFITNSPESIEAFIFAEVIECSLYDTLGCVIMKIAKCIREQWRIPRDIDIESELSLYARRSYVDEHIARATIEDDT